MSFSVATGRASSFVIVAARKAPRYRASQVEQHLARLREGLIPLAERCGRVMRAALAALEGLRAGPSPAVERSRPVRISIVFEPEKSMAEPAPEGVARAEAP